MKSNKIILTVLILSMITLIFSGCGTPTAPSIPDQGDSINHNPIISDLSASPRTGFINQTNTITCIASDQDDDPLTYRWSKTGGTITESGSTIAWKSPATEGNYTITCTVSDNKGGEDKKSVNIEVDDNKYGDPRTIDWSMAESNGWANPLGEGKELVTSTAYDYDSGIYLYNWGEKHMGIDIIGELDGNVYSIADGTVDYVFTEDSWYDKYGILRNRSVVIIKHTNSNNKDFFAIYGHVLAKDELESTVKAGEKIGVVKKSGSPCHLHFGINISSEFICDFLAGECGWGRVPVSADPSDYVWVDPIEYLNTHLPLATLPNLISEENLDSFRVAFEDIEWSNWSGGDCQGNNDYDYEDCVCDVDVDGKFICGDYLKEVKFTITYQNDGSGNLDHEFGLKMPSIFVSKSCTYNLNGSISSRVPCPGEFIFFHKDTAIPGEVFYLTITFDSPFAYSYSGFVQTDIHGNLIDIKPFINIYWDSDNSFKEKLLTGTGDKRVLLVPDGWQWPSSDSTPLWDVYAEVIETDCYPEFTNPGTWTWTGGTSISVSIIMEEFNGSSIGDSYGIVYTNTINGQGAVFSRVKESRIEYPFSIGFPHEGTIEYLIKVYHGYRYSDYVLNDNLDCARIFDTGSQDVWYPGAIWIDVCDNGTINLGTATAWAQPESHNLKATGTDFTFNEWHTIGISFGSQGQYIMLDGNIVAANASYTETLQTCGNFTSSIDIPTVGELVSCFWVNNRHDKGFEGVIDRFRVSEEQKDWYLSETSPSQ